IKFYYLCIILDIFKYKILILIIMKSIAKQTETYVYESPDIKNCLKKGLINYSALSRRICKDLGIKNFQAVLIALQRIQRKDNMIDSSNDIMDLIKNSKTIIRTKIMVAIVQKPRNFLPIQHLQTHIKSKNEDFNIIEGEETYTLITNMKYSQLIKEKLKHWLIKTNENFVKVCFVFDEKIETTPGVVSYIYSMLAEHGVNIIEEMSCWKDLFIIIKEEDLPKVLNIFSLFE
ncbi:MAG: ACT domain-containing protein, partial [Candidatus Anstonellales archaeon]